MLNWLWKLSRGRGPARETGAARAAGLRREAEADLRAARPSDAAGRLVAALQAAPDDPAAHYLLGRAMRALGEPARAVTAFRRAIELDPRHRDAWIDLASALLALDAAQPAEEAARAALALDAASVEAHANLAGALEAQGRIAEAIASCDAALALEPDFAPALANRAALRLRAGELEGAQADIEHAIRLAPEDPELLVRSGHVLMEQRRAPEAAAVFDRVLQAHPGHAGALAGLAFAHDQQGDLDAALAGYERILAANPEDAQAHVNRAAIRLMREDYAGGWEEFEWRRRIASQAPLYGRFDLPSWHGEDPAGLRVLVHAEQGLGDEILFASCLPDLLARAAHCVIDCEPRLAGLLRRAFPQAAVHGARQGDATDWLRGAGPLDCAIPAGSLPLLFRRSVADFPRHDGYLRADPARVERWRERLRALGDGPRVGLSWRGGVPQTGRGARSMALDELLPALRVPGLVFVNLQYTGGSAELAALRERHGVAVHEFPEAIADYEETAALVCALDLTLSVCTALVDLAGALGRPVWAMAPVRPDFRYGPSGPDMRWYPSARVFRQRGYGDWRPVAAEVAGALEDFKRARR